MAGAVRSRVAGRRSAGPDQRRRRSGRRVCGPAGQARRRPRDRHGQPEQQERSGAPAPTRSSTTPRPTSSGRQRAGRRAAQSRADRPGAAAALVGLVRPGGVLVNTTVWMPAPRRGARGTRRRPLRTQRRRAAVRSSSPGRPRRAPGRCRRAGAAGGVGRAARQGGHRRRHRQGPRAGGSRLTKAVTYRSPRIAPRSRERSRCASRRSPAARVDGGIRARRLRCRHACVAGHLAAPGRHRGAGRVGAHLVQPRAGDHGGAGGPDRRPQQPRSVLCQRRRSVRRRVDGLCTGRIDVGADHCPLLPGLGRSFRPRRLPRAAGRSDRRTAWSGSPGSPLESIGTAVGPAVGGLLTQAFAWQSIFVVQVPVAVLAVPAALAIRGTARTASRRDRPAIGPNVALALLSAALTAALFLLVLLLVDGWNRSPATAAITVSVVPLAAFAAGPLSRPLHAPPAVEAATGCFLVAGGLVGLALLPSADLAWTVLPQMLIGFGLGLTVDRLTIDAMRERSPRAVHGGWTIAARHAGVVLGTSDPYAGLHRSICRAAQTPAQEAITALVLDAPVRAQDKVALAQGLSDQLTREQRSGTRSAPGIRQAASFLQRSVRQPLCSSAVSTASSNGRRPARSATPFCIGAGLALAALASLIVLRRRAVRHEPQPSPADHGAARCRRRTGQRSARFSDRQWWRGFRAAAHRRSVRRADGQFGLDRHRGSRGAIGHPRARWCGLPSPRLPRGAHLGSRATRHAHRRADQRPTGRTARGRRPDESRRDAAAGFRPRQRGAWTSPTSTGS